MPNEWSIYLQKSSLTFTEKMQNPQAVIDALEFFDSQMKNSSSKYMYSSDKSKLVFIYFILNDFQKFTNFLYIFFKDISMTPPRNNSYCHENKLNYRTQTNLTTSVFFFI